MAGVKGLSLRWANRFRARWAEPPLAELPPGMRRQATACPLARAIGHGAVVERRLHLGGNSFRTPLYVRLFISRFDRGKYPELRPAEPERAGELEPAAGGAQLALELDPLGALAEDAARHGPFRGGVGAERRDERPPAEGRRFGRDAARLPRAAALSG